MSYRDADMYSDVVDVLDNIRDNVDAYVTNMQAEEAQATCKGNDNGVDSNKVNPSNKNQDHALVAATLVSSPVRLYIKENGPLVIRLSKTVQGVLRDVVEHHHCGLGSANEQDSTALNVSEGPTAEAARSDAVRALVTRKLGELMENAHAMRSVVKQQRQQQSSTRFGQPLFTSISTPDDTGATDNNVRMKQLLRVILQALEDTERLLRIGFPETRAATLSPTAPAPPTILAAATSTSPPCEDRGSFSPTFSNSSSSHSPERASLNAMANAYSASNTPRDSTSTAPYVRRSESLDATGLLPPRQSSPSVRTSALHETSDASRIPALAARGTAEDSVRRSAEAPPSSSMLSTLQWKKPVAPIMQLAQDRKEAPELDDIDTPSELKGHPLLQDALKHSDRIRATGLTSNPVYFHPSTRNNSSITNDSESSGGGIGINTVAATVGRSISSVHGGLTQLAPFTHRRPPLTAAETANSSTASPTSSNRTEESAGERLGDGRIASDAVGEVEQNRSAPLRSYVEENYNGDGADTPSEYSGSLASLTEEGKETKPFEDAPHITAASDVPRGILKTSSSWLGGSLSSVKMATAAGADGSTNNSTSRSSAFSSSSNSRPVVQFADDVLNPQHRTKENSGHSNSNSTTVSDARGDDGMYGMGTTTTNTNNNNNNSISSLGSGRQRVLPVGLPPRSPRQPETPSVPLNVTGGQRPPLAPTPSVPASLAFNPASMRNIRVTSTHSHFLPGELWGDILEANKQVMVDVLRKDVIDLFNYGEEEPILHLNDVRDVHFNFADNYLDMRFGLEHPLSLTDSEIDLRLDLCSYPLMAGLYEEYFQEYHAQEFEPIEDSLTTLSNLTTPMRNSTRLSISGSLPSYREGKGSSSSYGTSNNKNSSNADPHPLASTFSLSLPTPQPLSPSMRNDQVPVVSPLSIATDNGDILHTPSIVGEFVASFPNTSHKVEVGVVLPPPTATPTAATAAAATAAASKTANNKGKPITPKTSSLLVAAVLSANNSGSDATTATTSGSIHASNAENPPSTTAPRTACRRGSKENDSTPSALSCFDGSTSTTSFAVAARRRDPATAGAADATSTRASSTSTNSNNNNSASKTRSSTHTVRVPGKHWEAVTALVPEDDMADAFLVDLSAALTVLPSEARASCKRIRFYLGSLVVKFRWNNAELYPETVPLTAADVDSKLAHYTFTALRHVYATSCATLHLTNDIVLDDRKDASATHKNTSKKLQQQEDDNQEGNSLSSFPKALFSLPEKAELDHKSADTTPALESSTVLGSVEMQHRGEGAPSRSPSLSLNTLTPGANPTTFEASGRKVTATHPRRSEAVGSEAAAATATRVDAAQAPRKSSPDPVSVTYLIRMDSRNSSTSGEAEPRATTPLPSKPTAISRSWSSSQRCSHTPVESARTREGSSSGSGGGIAPSKGADVPPSRERPRSGSKDDGRCSRSTASGTWDTTTATTAARPTTTTTATTTMALNCLGRKHSGPLRTLLQRNPAVADVGPFKMIPVPDGLVVPRTPTPTLPKPAAAASRAENTSTPSGNESSSDAQAAAAAASAAQSNVPRSTSARRRYEDGAVASLRSRPRLMPKETTPGQTTAEPATTTAISTSSTRRTETKPHEPQPPTNTATAIAATRRADPSRVAAAAITAAEKAKERSNRTALSAISSRVPPPLSVADVETRRTPRGTTTNSGHAAVSALVVASAGTAGAAPTSAHLSTSNFTETTDLQEHLAYSHSTARKSQSEVNVWTEVDKHRSNSASAKKSTSASRPRGASPRWAQAVTGRASRPPDHVVYHLIPEVLEFDPLLRPSNAMQDPSESSATRSARRQRQQQQQQDVFGGQTRGWGNVSTDGSSEAVKVDCFSALTVENEIGLRLNGLIVDGVRKRGIAAEAGMQVGDTLRTMDGQILTSELDFYRGLLQHQHQQQKSGSEHALFVTAVNARGNPATYRLRLPAMDTTGLNQYSTMWKASGASTAAATLLPQPSPQPPAAQSGRANRHSLLVPPARTWASTATTTAASASVQHQQQPSSERVPSGHPHASSRPVQSTVIASTSVAVDGGGDASCGEAVKVTPAVRLRVRSTGVVTHEKRAQRSNSNRMLRNTEVPTIVRQVAGPASSSAPLSARRAGRDDASAAHARAHLNQ